jgi:hypothetical protein
MLIIISLVSLSSGSLSVLRVLTRQTLEISTEVKDSSFPDPSLAKVVKDSTLTILSSLDLLQLASVKKGALLRVYSAEGAHYPSLRRFDLGSTVEIWERSHLACTCHP